MSRKLSIRKQRIEALLPLTTGQRQQNMLRILKLINDKLGITTKGETGLAQAAAGIDGVGGLQFQSSAPPGEGRLLRLPFQYVAASADAGDGGNLNGLGPGCYTAAGGGVAPTITTTPTGTVLFVQPMFQWQQTDPVVVPNRYDTLKNFKITNLLFQTPQLEYLKMRLVGLQYEAKFSPFYPLTGRDYQGGGPPAAPTTVTTGVGAGNYPRIIARNLRVGGGGNLFLADGFQDLAAYNHTITDFCGLRAYPVVESPNQIFVELAITGESFYGLQSATLAEVQNWVAFTVAPVPSAFPTVMLSVWAVVEVLEDQEYGQHDPGPYARSGALDRYPSPQGDSFVTSS